MEKPRIRNEYRLAWRKGDLSEIPADVLLVLETEYAHEKGMDKDQATVKKAQK
jgi:hypothetical protein